MLGNASTGFVVVNTLKKQINDSPEINDSPNNGTSNNVSKTASIPSTSNSKNVPKTGDTSELEQWLVLMAGAAVIAIVSLSLIVGFYKKEFSR